MTVKAGIYMQYITRNTTSTLHVCKQHQIASGNLSLEVPSDGLRVNCACALYPYTSVKISVDYITRGLDRMDSGLYARNMASVFTVDRTRLKLKQRWRSLRRLKYGRKRSSCRGCNSVTHTVHILNMLS